MNEITLDLPADLANHLALMAQRTGRDESTLALEALRIYLERELEQIDELQRAVAEADAGDFASVKRFRQYSEKHLGIRPRLPRAWRTLMRADTQTWKR